MKVKTAAPVFVLLTLLTNTVGYTKKALQQMTKQVCVFLFAFAFLVTSVIASGQVTQQWVARYHGPNPGFDAAYALVLDRNFGHIYVTGASGFGGPAPASYGTVAYDTDGTQLWVAQYRGPDNLPSYATSIAVDSNSGNVYVTGYSGDVAGGADYATVAYDSSGHQLWDARYVGPGYSSAAYAIAVDASGNIYVTGESDGVGTGPDYLTVAYDSHGNQLWVARYNGPGNGEDDATAIAVDGTGNVYVTGRSNGGATGMDYASIAYDSAGNELWVARYNGPGNGYDEAVAIAVDRTSGHIFVTGNSDGGPSLWNWATLAYDTSGNQLWEARFFDGQGNEMAHAIAVDSAGNIFVTGTDGGVINHYGTASYNPTGGERWRSRYRGPANGVDTAHAVAVDHSGNVYITGASTSGTGFDYATIAYDNSGNQRWLARYDGPGHDTDQALSIAVDDAGNVYVTGYSDGGGSAHWEYATIKYSQP